MKFHCGCQKGGRRHEIIEGAWINIFYEFRIFLVHPSSLNSELKGCPVPLSMPPPALSLLLLDQIKIVALSQNHPGVKKADRALSFDGESVES